MSSPSRPPSPPADPVDNDVDSQPRPHRTHGVLSSFKPTHAEYYLPDKDDALPSTRLAWRSRDHRKGRHTVLIAQPTDPMSPRTSKLRRTLATLSRLFTTFPYWDISYIVSLLFVLGSIVWVINGFFVLLPLLRPETEFATEVAIGGGVTAFIGATIFAFGSWGYVLEVINEDDTPCFGWAIRGVKDRIEDGLVGRLAPCPEQCRHRYHMFGRRGRAIPSPTQAQTQTEKLSASSNPSPRERSHSWTWCPSLTSLRTNHIHSIGFWGSIIQALGASIFWIAGFTSLPWILDHTDRHLLADGIYWTPQVVGGPGFIIAGILFMLETQRKWYTPALGVLGWHVGFWNFLGGLGFTLSGAFGYSTLSGMLFQSSLSTFWGGWAFLIGSVVQWYESVDKYPIELMQSRPY